MRFKSPLIAASALLNLTVGVAAAVATLPQRTTQVYQDATQVYQRATAAKQIMVTPSAGVPDTMDFRSALKQCDEGVRSAASMLQEAEANPMDRMQIEWGGEGINCEGDGAMDAFECTGFFGPYGDAIPEMLNYSVLIDPNRKYTNEEPIICVVGTDGAAEDNQHVCLHLEDTERDLKGVEVQVLLGLLYNPQCKHCGHVPIRLIEDGVNEKPWDGLLVANDHINSTVYGNCNGVCGVGMDIHAGSR